jgi:hypothetical protein
MQQLLMTSTMLAFSSDRAPTPTGCFQGRRKNCREQFQACSQAYILLHRPSCRACNCNLAIAPLGACMSLSKAAWQ